MKKSRVTLFAFRPEDYRAMEDYLHEMLRQGWKLRWCRGILAGFEAAEDSSLRYAADPYAMTSVTNFRRYPRSRLQAAMEAGWWGVGHTKGCQILCTNRSDAVSPVPQQDLAPLIRSTCRLGSMITLLCLLLAGWYLLSKAAVLSALILSNLYLMGAAAWLFLVLYHAVNIALLTAGKSPRTPRSCIRYLVHNSVLTGLLILAAVLEIGSRNDMMLYLLLPILVAGVSIVVLRSLSSERSPQRLFPVVIFTSILMLGLIVFMNRQMGRSNEAWANQQQQTLLEQADQLPVLHLSDFGDSTPMNNAAKSSTSLLGGNLLYAEESEWGYVFTNYTLTSSPFLSQQIFRNLYQQAQRDFAETFVMKSDGDLTYYALENANTYLMQSGSVICLCTFPTEAEPGPMLRLILDRQAT